jgi:hypothetical protein
VLELYTHMGDLVDFSGIAISSVKFSFSKLSGCAVAVAAASSQPPAVCAAVALWHAAAPLRCLRRVVLLPQRRSAAYVACCWLVETFSPTPMTQHA